MNQENTLTKEQLETRNEMLQRMHIDQEKYENVVLQATNKKDLKEWIKHIKELYMVFIDNKRDYYKEKNTLDDLKIVVTKSFSTLVKNKLSSMNFSNDAEKGMLGLSCVEVITELEKHIAK